MDKRRKQKTKTVPVEVTYTEGYEKRFTETILRIYEKRKREGRLETEQQQEEGVIARTS